MATTQATINGVVVLPSSHKFDLVLTQSWTRTAGSRLALVCYIQTTTGDGVSPTAGNDASASGGSQAGSSNMTTSVAFGDAALPFATFDWAATVTYNGVPTNVANVITSTFDAQPRGADLPATDSLTRVAFSFDQVDATSIEWDPVLAMGSGSVGTTGSTTQSGASIVSSVSAIAIAAVAGLIAVIA